MHTRLAALVDSLEEKVTDGIKGGGLSPDVQKKIRAAVRDNINVLNGFLLWSILTAQKK
jgi:hypothetical protein